MNTPVTPPSRILVVGAGAIGGFYGAALQIGGADTAVVCRSEFEEVSANGYVIESKVLGERRFRPTQVLKTAAAYQGAPPDYLVLCVKVTEGTDRVALIREAAGPRTVIVLIENGIEIEAEIAEAFPDQEVVSALAFVQVSRTAPGRVRHFAFGDLTFGNFPSGLSEASRNLASILEAGGVKCHLTDSVASARWQKCLWNAAYNPVSVLGGVFDTDDMLGTPEGVALVRNLMLEIAAVAGASGHPVPQELIDRYLSATAKAPAYRTSMALDYEHGRPLETEVILGNAVRAGRREGVSIPRLEMLYALMKMVERKARKRQDGPAR